MRNQPIWESSCRPLFVRSIWLEAQKGGLRGHRHFLLEEEFTATRKHVMKHEKLKQSHTFDFSDLTVNDEGVTLQLIGSPKEQFHIEYQKPRPPLPFNLNRRSAPSLRTLELNGAAPSKTSSLQDIHSQLSVTSHLDEKLAERVLQWLDLAGKAPMQPLIQEPFSKKPPLPVIHKTRMNASTVHVRKVAKDSVKHVTIIFDKEGTPKTFNRPTRYGDNLQPNRKTAGMVASARLYSQSIEACKLDLARKERPKSSSVRKPSYDEVDSGRLTDWSKKEIHIFMPSLPKTPVGNTSATEESVSFLSSRDK